MRNWLMSRLMCPWSRDQRWAVWLATAPLPSKRNIRLKPCGAAVNRRLVQTIILGAATLGCGSDITAPNLPAKPAAPTVALGSLFSCALTLNAKPYCWGDNLSGQLGTLRDQAA